MVIGDGSVLNGDTLIRKQSQELYQIQLVKLWAAPQIFRKPCLRCKDLNAILFNT